METLRVGSARLGSLARSLVRWLVGWLAGRLAGPATLTRNLGAGGEVRYVHA